LLAVLLAGGLSSADRSIKVALRVGDVLSLARINQKITPSNASNMAASNMGPHSGLVSQN
jgi:hypothetical protein